MASKRNEFSPAEKNQMRKHWEEDDYHGNFDAPQFERWFKRLCKTFKEGGSNIHMGGASYHMRVTNKAPAKGQIVEWIIENVGYVFNPKATKDKLLEIEHDDAWLSAYRHVQADEDKFAALA
ncbi:hypothetical protein P43SY_008091 [Pythium insidiosum]|uniref:Uncharacterized protein n=1 Tax=Pythium insidiosum TaxID=114742 RepID=A0AAD5Q3G8_PYTIN|nr:hypothetical protein P43SY_008091 [Pythium insidiosum]